MIFSLHFEEKTFQYKSLEQEATKETSCWSGESDTIICQVRVQGQQTGQVRKKQALLLTVSQPRHRAGRRCNKAPRQPEWKLSVTPKFSTDNWTGLLASCPISVVSSGNKCRECTANRLAYTKMQRVLTAGPEAHDAAVRQSTYWDEGTKPLGA